jgi:hypothetical protein
MPARWRTPVIRGHEMEAMDGVPARRAERMWAITFMALGIGVTVAWLGAIAYAIDFVAGRL